VATGRVVQHLKKLHVSLDLTLRAGWASTGERQQQNPKEQPPLIATNRIAQNTPRF